MKITQVSYDKTIAIQNNEIFLDNIKKQVVFVWRSNVWKSSLMNAIFGTKDLVKTSSKPGKTRQANLFLVNNKFHFVDLPGYWFAKVSQEQKQVFDNLISWYLEEFKFYIKKLVIVLDSKIGPTQTDIDMFNFIQSFQIPVVFALNKIDKLGNNDANLSKSHFENLFFGQQAFMTSTTKKIWIRELSIELFDSLTKN